GAATYKAKCAGCHGAEGQGKVGPALKGTSLTADQITDLLTKGNDAKKAPHKKALSALSADDAKAVAEFVKTLKQVARCSAVVSTAVKRASRSRGARLALAPQTQRDDRRYSFSSPFNLPVT